MLVYVHVHNYTFVVRYFIISRKLNLCTLTHCCIHVHVHVHVHVVEWVVLTNRIELYTSWCKFDYRGSIEYCDNKMHGNHEMLFSLSTQHKV